MPPASNSNLTTTNGVTGRLKTAPSMKKGPNKAAKFQALAEQYEAEAIRNSLDLQHHIHLYNTAKKERDMYRERLADTEARLNLETAKLQLHMEECSIAKDRAMKHLGMGLENERNLMLENTHLKSDLAQARALIQEGQSAFEVRLATEGHLMAEIEALRAQLVRTHGEYQEDRSRLGLLKQKVLPLTDCSICLGTIIMPTLTSITKRPVVSVTHHDIVVALTGIDAVHQAHVLSSDKPFRSFLASGLSRINGSTNNKVYKLIFRITNGTSSRNVGKGITSRRKQGLVIFGKAAQQRTQNDPFSGMFSYIRHTPPLSPFEIKHGGTRIDDDPPPSQVETQATTSGLGEWDRAGYRGYEWPIIAAVDPDGC
ncbi:hypothetical protein ARMGADRAFT_1030301 [Armillaria gallica]|uniref:Uncharacterized protein n=1 Tax=Armillaria gallica TaxID=47427 RepID=A0A2H3DQI3_ARMGA|nr:hypothetical protein ARMGADRAFT_1030301 [Armillaria gallica]